MAIPQARMSLALALLLLLSVEAKDVLAKEGRILQPRVDPAAQPQCTTRYLQGNAEVRQILNPALAAWTAQQYYRTGTLAMNYGQYDTASQWFDASANIFQAALGPCKMVGEARFAQAQMYRLLGQQARAAAVFRLAADIFQRCDPYNPFLKAAMDLSQQPAAAPPAKPLTGKVTKTKIASAAATRMPKLDIALPRMAETVSRDVVLKGKAGEDSIKLSALKDDQVFGLGKALPDAIAANVSDGYIKGAVKKAFLKMTCLEMAALGGNLYTAPGLYEAFKAKGKPVVVGAADEFWSPVLHVKLNGKEYGVCMELPGLAHGSKVILPVTDGEHVLAIDPKTGDCWKLQATPARRTADFNWWKLTHSKSKVL